MYFILLNRLLRAGCSKYARPTAVETERLISFIVLSG